MDLGIWEKSALCKTSFKNAALLLFLFLVISQQVKADEFGYALITSSKNPAFNSDEHFDTKKLRAIFSGKKQRLETGHISTIYMLPEKHQSVSYFIKNKLKTQVYKLKKTWHIQRYTGSGKQPVSLSSYEEIISKVKSSKYSIGLVPVDIDIDSTLIKVNL